MPFDLIDKFAGSAGDSLFGHAPNVGTTAWSSAQAYPGSVLKLTGAGYVYNDRAGGSSLAVWPGSTSGLDHVIRCAFRFNSSIGTGASSGVTLWTDSAASQDCRFLYNHQLSVWALNGVVGGNVTSAFTFPAAGTEIEVRITLTEVVSTSRTVTVEVSNNAGVTWTTLFGGAKSMTLTGSSFLPGVWFDLNSTGSAGVLIGNLRVGPPSVQPSMTGSPASIIATGTASISLVGTGTNWRSGTPGLPGFTVSGGAGPSISSQVVAGVDSATIQLAAGSSAGTLTITDPSGGTAVVTVTAASTFGVPAQFMCQISNVPSGVTPTFELRNLDGTAAAILSGGSAVQQGDGAFTVTFEASNAGSYVGVWAVSGLKILDEVRPVTRNVAYYSF